MKHHIIRLTGVFWVLMLAVIATAGTWSNNNFFYKPDVGARGPQEKTSFDTGLDRVDKHLGAEKILGDFGYSTLSEALTTINTIETTLVIPYGAVNVAGNTTIPSNVHLRILKGGYFNIADGCTLTINGTVEAGPYQIFSWSGTGAIDLSGSPMNKVYLQWWGALAGRTNDCSTHFAKAYRSIGPHQNIHLTKGTWRIASPLTFNKNASGHDYGFGICGENPSNTLIYIDVGSSNNGMTFGESSYSFYQTRIKNLGIIGPANACKNGLVFIQNAEMEIENVNFRLGATEYAAVFQGCLWTRLKLDGGRTYFNYGDYAYSAAYANFIKLELSPISDYQNNVWDLELHHTGSITGKALFINGNWENDTRVQGLILRITGSIEYCINDYPISMNNVRFVTIQDMYLSDGNAKGFFLDRCEHIKLLNLDGVQDDNILKRCKDILISDAKLNNLEIQASCENVVLNNVEIYDANGLKDEGRGTIYATPVHGLNVQLLDRSLFPSPGNDALNLMDNAAFYRWQSDRPDGGWNTNNNTWTKCGIGETDTTRHRLQKCAKATTNGADAWILCTLPGSVLDLIKGKQITYSAWLNAPTGQSFSSYPSIGIQQESPDWSSSTSYVVGDRVVGGAGRFLCIKAGTSGGSAPTWPGQGEVVTDNTVEWLGVSTTNDTGLSTPVTSGDLGTWKQLQTSAFIGKNSTAVYLKFNLPRQGNTSNSSCYIAEPFVQVGVHGPSGTVLGKDEHSEYISIAGRKISFGSAAPTSGWWDKGDVRFNTGATAGGAMGWMCTAAGSPGTWKAMGNLAP